MEEILTQTVEGIIERYQICKDSERYYLMYLNLESENNELEEIEIPRIPSVSQTIPMAPPYMKPFTNAYITIPINIAAKEKQDLDFLPYDERTKSAHFSTDLEIYKTHPYDQYKHSDDFIQNKQFSEYLVLSLLKLYPLTQDWKEVSNVLADGMGKSRRLLLSVFNDVISSRFQVKSTLTYQNFNENFCQICLKYCCATHFYDEREEEDSGNLIDEAKVKAQYLENVMSVIDKDSWKLRWWSQQKCKSTDIWIKHYHCQPAGSCGIPTQVVKPLSLIEAQLVKGFLKQGISNPCAISLFLGLPCSELKYQTIIYKSKYKEPIKHLPPPTSIFYTSNFDYAPTIVNVIEAHCKCQGECSVKNKCPCIIGEVLNNKVIARRVCEKFCTCSLTCRQRFLGCNCEQGRCLTKTCVCYMNLRECDPELCVMCNCKYSAGFELPEKKKRTKGSCCNIRNQSRASKKTGMGESSIIGAGIGLFILENCEKGEYITEYTGELIRESESERRSTIYDFKHHSYIFSMSPEARWSIDSTYFGSKMRYVNHKSHNEHNCYTQVWNVRGHIKILLFSAQKLQAGEELFFDYGYDSNLIKYDWLQQYENKFKNKRPKIN